MIRYELTVGFHLALGFAFQDKGMPPSIYMCLNMTSKCIPPDKWLIVPSSFSILFHLVASSPCTHHPPHPLPSSNLTRCVSIIPVCILTSIYERGAILGHLILSEVSWLHWNITTVACFQIFEFQTQIYHKSKKYVIGDILKTVPFFSRISVF